MKMKRYLIAALAVVFVMLSFAGCKAREKGSEMNGDGAAFVPAYPNAGASPDEAMKGDAETQIPGFAENPFIATQEEAVSTFSADVDTASYTYFRKLVGQGYRFDQIMANGESFRTEEFLNYFKYEASAPQNGELFGVMAAIFDCPWNSGTKLMSLTLQAEEAAPEAGNNLVFLIDVSGSMSASDKLPLLKKSFTYLVSQLNADDRVSIVTYSGKEKVVLSGCPGDQSKRIMDAINGLKANGVTNGEAGLKMAYTEAERNFIANGNNRIIMASDGDLNVGISSAEELKRFVEGKRDNGVYLSILGFGTGNYRDSKMEALADNGNGVYYYIDGESEAERIFGTDLLSTLYTVAKDVKLQITFDPEYVASYRLIGYENRVMDKEDFDDDRKDAGEVGAGHQVTVLYELTVIGDAAQADTWMELGVRYKRPGEEVSQLNRYAIGCRNIREPGDDLLFQTAVVETCMVLHNSKYLKDIDLAHVLEILNGLELSSGTDRAEFRDLLRKLAK